MGVILELARAKQKIIAQDARIAELEKQIPALVVPVTDLMMVSRSDFIAEMRKANIEPISLTTPLDAKLSLTSKAELDRIAPELVYPADWYVAQIWDCDDYGIQAQCDAGHKFGVSGVRLGLGNMPLGYHGFALTMDKEASIWWLESNAGFPYAGVWHKIGIRKYVPDKIFV